MIHTKQFLIPQKNVLEADEFIKAIPNAKSFRRSSSLYSNPTTQGLSLKGSAPTATSRSLLLRDGLSLNDPFAAWISWNSVLLRDVRRISEVPAVNCLRYGSYCLDGALEIESSREGSLAYFDLGSFRSRGQGVILNSKLNDYNLKLDFGLFESDGYFLLDSSSRGLIDRRIDVRAKRFKTELGFRDSNIGFSFYDASRGAGTDLTRNAQKEALLSFKHDLKLDKRLKVSFLTYFKNNNFSSFFTAQEQDRGSERPALDQFDVPSTEFYFKTTLKRESLLHLFSAGIDYSLTEGRTKENFFFVDGDFRRSRMAGGKQDRIGFFVDDEFSFNSKLKFYFGSRLSFFADREGFREEKDRVTTLVLKNENFKNRNQFKFSPSASITYQLLDDTIIDLSSYSNFRMASLNELYRPFRVRNDITEANQNLDPENLKGLALSVRRLSEGSDFQLKGFFHQIEDPIINKSIVGDEPGQIAPCGFVPSGGSCRVRSNLEKADVYGLAFDLVSELTQQVSAIFRYAFIKTNIRDSGKLDGNSFPQNPKHNARFELSYRSDDFFNPSLGVVFVGSQYENDINSLKLASHTSFNIDFEKEIFNKTLLKLRFKNIFNNRAEVAKTTDGLVSFAEPFGAYISLDYLF